MPADLGEIKRVLRPEGRLSIAVHAWAIQSRLDATSPVDAIHRLRVLVEEGGFSVLKAEVGIARSRAPLYLLAKRTAVTRPYAT